MGFEVMGATVTLEFGADTLLSGATVACSLDMSVRQFVQLQRMWAAVGDGDMENVERAFSTFGDAALKSWDLEADGVPVPANGEGLTMIPLAAAMAVFKAWSDAVAAKSPNSRAASGNGATSEAA